MTVQDVIKLDPTLDAFVNTHKFDYKNLTHQMELRKVAFLIGLRRYLDRQYGHQ